MIYVNPKDHYEKRIVVHPSQRQHHIEPISTPLYVACAISNPQRYYTRYRHYQSFEKYMQESGVILFTVELALRDRHHEITDHNNPYHIQLRSDTELWHKENILNIGVSRFPHDWRYGSIIDADFLFTRMDWAYETLHMLQHYSWVQLFSTYSNLNKNFAPVNEPTFGFVKAYKDKLNTLSGSKSGLKVNVDSIYDMSHWVKTGLGAPGGAWAFRREAFDAVGGLLDKCILGSGDLHMCVGLSNIKNYFHPDLNIPSDKYIEAIKSWQENAYNVNKGSVGYINNHAIHLYHGSNIDRGYRSRTEILKKHLFDPTTDIKYDSQGVLSWRGNKPELEEDVRLYFKSRDEDS